MYRPTDRRIDPIYYKNQYNNPNIGRAPQRQGGGFLSGMNNTMKTMNNLNKLSNGRVASGMKGLANKGLKSMGMPTFAMPTSSAAPYAANSSQAAGELARAAQSAGYAPEFGIQGTTAPKTGILSGIFGGSTPSAATPIAANASPAAAEIATSAQSAGYAPVFGLAGAGTAATPTAASIASGATSMGAPAASLAAAEAAGAGASAAGAGASAAGAGASTAGAASSASAVPYVGWVVAAALMAKALYDSHNSSSGGGKKQPLSNPNMGNMSEKYGGDITSGDAIVSGLPTSEIDKYRRGL